MILYFSATGNSKYVAERISKGLNDPYLLDMATAYKKRLFSYELKENEPLFIISPTYDWGIPSIVFDFLSEASFSFGHNQTPYIAYIATYGTSPGASDIYVKKIMARKGLALSFSYSIKMPDTWTALFDLSDKEKVKRINLKAEGIIDEAIEKLKSGEKGLKMKNRLPFHAANLYYKIGYPKTRKTSHLKVEDACIGCGMCEKMCPVGAIKMENGKPSWTKDRCVMCLGCLHRCPKFAIQYGDKTKKHGQYQHRFYEEKGMTK